MYWLFICSQLWSFKNKLTGWKFIWRKMDPSFEEHSSAFPRKRTRTNCIIHYTDEDIDSLVSPKDLESWNILLGTDKIRKHALILDIAKELPEGKIPPTEQYHRKCRSIFTMKRILDLLYPKKEIFLLKLQNRVLLLIMEDISRWAKHIQAVQCTVFPFPKLCKYLKGKNNKGSPHTVHELHADARVREVVTKKFDQRMLAITSRELVAAEGHYQRSCYRLYTKDNFYQIWCVCKYGTSHRGELLSDNRNTFFKELLSYIRNELIPNPKGLPMTDLTSRLQAYMSSCGINQVNDSTKKHLHRKLQTKVEGALHTFSDDKGKLLLYPDSLK